MKTLIPICALAVALGAPLAAQDSTTRSTTQVKTDDAKTMSMRGCLTQNSLNGRYELTGATAMTGDDLTSSTTVKTDVDKDDTTVTARTKVDSDTRGTTGIVAFYEVTPRAGVSLAPHVGHQVQISAVLVPAGRGDADVKITDQTTTKVDDAPDAKAKTTTRAEIAKGPLPQLTAVAITDIAASCTP